MDEHKMEYGTLYLCEFCATVEIADQNITQCFTHRAPEEISGLMVLDDETRYLKFCVLLAIKEISTNSLRIRKSKG